MRAAAIAVSLLSILGTPMALTAQAPAADASADLAHRLESQRRTQPWGRDLVAAMATLPVQHDGREKPLLTLAAFTLYSVHGRRDLKRSTENGKDETLSPTE